jgi:hypothetical protein
MELLRNGRECGELNVVAFLLPINNQLNYTRDNRGFRGFNYSATKLELFGTTINYRKRLNFKQL